MTLASSCNRDEDGLNPPERYGTVTLTADAARTKTLLDGNSVKWEDGDEIALRFTHDTKTASVGNFSTSIGGDPVASADFTGTVAADVLREDGGWHETAYAVYPATALAEDGASFSLPADQKARADGAFAPALNLASAHVSLSDIRDDGKASAEFVNALSILRFSVTGDDVTSVTLSGSSPVAGSAPLKFSEADGRLVIDDAADWADTDKEMSVTLVPADGSECFTAGTAYNLLIWPGSHESLTVTLGFKDYGDFVKSKDAAFTFEASKFYTLDFNADSETIVKEITDGLDAVEPEMAGLEERLAALETTAEKVSLLLDQIQSVALITEYLDNSVYAPYAQLMYSKLKDDIELDFIVRPAKAAELLLELCAEEGNLSDVLSAQIDYKDGTLGTLAIKDAMLDEDVLTVVVDSENINDDFYTGGTPASVALCISDGNTDILSDFAVLVPKEGAMMKIDKTEDIPVLKGAGMSMTFTYGASNLDACAVTVENAVGFASTPTVKLSSSTGYFSADFAEDADLSQMSVDLVLTCGDESDVRTLTFVDGGDFVVQTSGTVDYIGGEVSVSVVSNSFGSVSSELTGGGDWMYQTYSGNNSSLTVEANEGAQRSAYVVFTIRNNWNITYTKSVAITQKATGTPIDESRYHQTKGKVELQAASAGLTPLNIVIVGDGYQKKDLLKGGKFERSARSAMDAFFGVEPYKSFRDRFRVMMVAYESDDEGISLQGGEPKNTYFNSYYKGGGDTYVNLSGGNYEAVKTVVQSDLGWSDDATYYRTIVIMLINTDAGIGSNAPLHRDSYSGSADLGEPYASMAFSMVAANNTETSNLIRHEAGGHAFGRLGDEYPGKTWDSEVNDMHKIGWYRNITVNKSLWNWDEFILAGYEDVTYYQPNSSYWCPIDHANNNNSIMYNNLNKFNAPCRRIIYERIIRQTEGASAYSWEKFLEYDKRNL